MELKFRKLHPDAIIPTKAYDGDLGWDLYALHDISIPPDSNILVPTGIACAFPPGVGAILKDRSGVSSTKRVYVKAGVIDNAYRGEVKILLENPNTGEKLLGGLGIDSGARYFMKGEKIAQMILIPTVDCSAVEVEFLDETERHERGFGSSGV